MSNLADEIIVGEFKMTGDITIDVDKVVKKWNHLWMLAEWRRDNTWRLTKYVRKDSPNTAIKISISVEQAKELIDKLNLESQNSGFTSGFDWRRDVDREFLEEWRVNKLVKKYK